MGALPRPSTPGPWKYDKSIGTVVTPGGEPSDADMEAVAATPERIAREDRVREVCDKVITAVGFPRLGRREAPEATVARHILRLLDGEEA